MGRTKAEIAEFARRARMARGEEFSSKSSENSREILDDIPEEKLDLYAKVYDIQRANPDCIKVFNWLVYGKEHERLDGKWMVFSTDIDYLNNLCKEAVEKDLVKEAKFSFSSNEPGGACVACLYINADDIEGNKKLLKYLLDKGAIRRTKTGKLYNISFKFDDQTRAKEYGEDFKAKICLADYLNLETGEFIK